MKSQTFKDIESLRWQNQISLPLNVLRFFYSNDTNLSFPYLVGSLQGTLYKLNRRGTYGWGRIHLIETLCDSDDTYNLTISEAGGSSTEVGIVLRPLPWQSTSHWSVVPDLREQEHRLGQGVHVDAVDVTAPNMHRKTPNRKNMLCTESRDRP